MLPKDRATLDREHGVNAHQNVRIGNRFAYLLNHTPDWQTAMVTANYCAKESRLRHFVVWCPTHREWMVWATNQSLVSRRWLPRFGGKA